MWLPASYNFPIDTSDDCHTHDGCTLSVRPVWLNVQTSCVHRNSAITPIDPGMMAVKTRHACSRGTRIICISSARAVAMDFAHAAAWQSEGSALCRERLWDYFSNRFVMWSNRFSAFYECKAMSSFGRFVRRAGLAGGMVPLSGRWVDSRRKTREHHIRSFTLWRRCF